MATSCLIKKLNPKLQSVFGILTKDDDLEIRKIFNNIDEILIEFAEFFDSNHVKRESIGLILTWMPSGQISISGFVGAGSDGDHCVGFIVSLYPTWTHDDFPAKQEWRIGAEIEADCQEKIYCGSMHCVHELPSITARRPIEAADALRSITTELMKLGKVKPLDYWLKLAGDSYA